MPNLFDIPMPEIDQPQPGVPSMGPMPVDQPPVASPEQMALANLFRQQMAGPEDEEIKRLREREDEIYARIMKGPRQRAKELTAEMWKDKYGVTENSGKLRRIFAGLAETGRAIGGGAKYESIPDKARELATKEYQTEVGPLQREASVLSSAQKAAKAQADLTRYRNEQLLKDWYVQQRKLGQTDEQIAMRAGLTKAQIDKLRSDTALTDEKANLTGQQTFEKQLTNEALAGTGGFKLTGQPANAAGINAMGERNPTDANNLIGTLGLIGTGGRNSAGNAGKQTVRETYMKDVSGWGTDGELHVVKVPSEKIYRENIPGGVNTSLSAAPPSWFQKPAAEARALAQIAPPGISAAQISPEPGRKSYKIQDVDGESYSTTPRPGNLVTQRVDPSHIDRLSSEFGLDKNKLKNFRTSRFTDFVGPRIKEPTERANAKRAYYESLSDLTRKSVNAFASRDDSDISGLFDSFENNLKAMTGELSPEAISIRQSAIDTISTRILELSGKAVTNQERALYMKALPNINSDAPATFVAKAMTLKHMLDMRKMFADARLRDDEIDRLYSTRGGQILANMAATQFRKIDEFRNATAAGKPITIGNKTYTNMDEAAKAIKNGMSRDTINKYFKQALKEAGINDAIPLD